MDFRRTAMTFAALAAFTSAAAQTAPLRRTVLDLDALEGFRPRMQGESVQGMAVHDGVMFALYHGGDCVVADIEKGIFLAEFQVEAARGTHCNNASFGVEYACEDSAFPLLYISECNAPSRCFVVDISPEGARSVATIRFEGTGIADFCDWFVDRCNRHLYAYGKSTGGGAVLKRFALPALDAMSVETVLTDGDVLREYSYPQGFFRIPQGSCIDGGRIYLPTGAPSAGSRYIHIIDAESGERTAMHCIDDIPLEPEGVCTFGGELLIIFGSRGSSGLLCAFGKGVDRDEKNSYLYDSESENENQR